MRVVHNGTRPRVRCGACRALARRHPATRVERPLPHLSVTRAGVADSSAVRAGGERQITDGAERVDAVCRLSNRDALLAAIAKARGWIDDIRVGAIGSFAEISAR